jgi:hypothetical protein
MNNQNIMLRITIVRLLADIVNRYTLIRKQKMFLRRQPPQWPVISGQCPVKEDDRKQKQSIYKNPPYIPLL